jgi:prolipoprotein diacylglyceryltransferase
MIPYFQIPALQLGPVAIQSFGVLAAAGVYLASRLIERQAIRRGLPLRPLVDFMPWGIAAGVIVAHHSARSPRSKDGLLPGRGFS